MARGRTIQELRWPNTPEFVVLAQRWSKAQSALMMSFVWKAYDNLRDDVFAKVDCNQAEADIERSITELLEPEIGRVMTGQEPFYVQHNSYERETAQPPPAQPPEYDIAFVFNQNPRIKVPLEAKVLQTDRTIADYTNDLQGNFLTCRYAPFVNVGGMLGYLLSGNADHAFDNIAQRLSCTLSAPPEFEDRHHRISDHMRSVPTGKPYPTEFRCHHLMLAIF